DVLRHDGEGRTDRRKVRDRCPCRSRPFSSSGTGSRRIRQNPPSPHNVRGPRLYERKHVFLDMAQLQKGRRSSIPPLPEEVASALAQNGRSVVGGRLCLSSSVPGEGGSAASDGGSGTAGRVGLLSRLNSRKISDRSRPV